MAPTVLPSTRSVSRMLAPTGSSGSVIRLGPITIQASADVLVHAQVNVHERPRRQGGKSGVFAVYPNLSLRRYAKRFPGDLDGPFVVKRDRVFVGIEHLHRDVVQGRAFDVDFVGGLL